MFLRKNQYHMNMIWHYHIFIHTHTGKMSGNILYSLCGHLSDGIWFSCRAKHTLFMMRTYGHKIIIFSSIIINHNFANGDFCAGIKSYNP